MSTVLSFENNFALHGLVPTYEVVRGLPGLNVGDLIVPLNASAMRSTAREMANDHVEVSRVALKAVVDATGSAEADVMTSIRLVRMNLIVLGRDRVRLCGKTVGIVRGPSMHVPNAPVVPFAPEHIID